MNIILLCGTLLGLSSVIMAAYVDHVLGINVSNKTLNGLLTAVRYHQLYAIFVSILGLYLSQLPQSKGKWFITLSAFLFILGICIFSFSIYLSVMMGISWIIYLTPMGGIVLMLAWCSLIYYSLLRIK